ncbi:angiopoietin-related protein 5-like isoform X1 [Fundulus heteroclitus]|uniref:Fibrinogen C-terminal domain-containing protein n=1 Tax=Fundulus heteroclitus TaxID=8078 RepID=A0A3Q2PUV0_FUNHE|nr:angiopoietin-related protein 5-like isoform X1 [Fundulus heteroclitus]XP_035987262.1 angiopoietin-related protein 5-like isoform X1 [Fundulus heteroclitus]
MKSVLGYCALIFTLLLSCSVQAAKKQKTVSSQGTDCTQIKTQSPDALSGVYVIQPAGANNHFKVYCEMTSDGGWTVFQRRSGGSVSFNRKWVAYKNGFGNLTEDYWLGLKKVFALTKKKSKKWILRVDLWDHKGGSAFAEYKNFRLGNEKTAFKLHVGKYSGNAGDAIRGAYRGIDQNGFGFSTIDRDNDGCSPCIFGDIAEAKCAFLKVGGWWYSRCGSAGLNGEWHPYGDHIGWASGLHWLTWKPPAPYSAKATRMMMKSM